MTQNPPKGRPTQPSVVGYTHDAGVVGAPLTTRGDRLWTVGCFIGGHNMGAQFIQITKSSSAQVPFLRCFYTFSHWIYCNKIHWRSFVFLPSLFLLSQSDLIILPCLAHMTALKYWHNNILLNITPAPGTESRNTVENFDFTQNSAGISELLLLWAEHEAEKSA